MSIDNPGVVDAIGVTADTDTVALSISDHLYWSDPLDHLATLQAKLNRYLAFIESGELVEKYPAAAGKGVQVAIYFRYPPSAEADRFLIQATDVFAKGGFSLTWRVLAA